MVISIGIIFPVEWRTECHWIGLKYTGDGWYWIDGSAMRSYLWDSTRDQPDESYGSCGCECNFSSEEDGGLHDCDCSYSSVYSICERPLACPDSE